MSEMENKPKKSWGSLFLYIGTIVVVAGITWFVTALLLNIQDRKQEAQQHYFEIVELDENTVDPATWGKNFPQQYDGYKRTVDTELTRHGGSEAINKLEQNPFLKRLYAGYLFSVDFREERGHAYMLQDQDETERVKKGKQPGACLHCHASVIPAYRKVGDGDVMKGFAEVCAMPWEKARELVSHPVTCLDCHDPESMRLRVTRPAFLNGIKALAESDYPLPHFASIERWRKDKNPKEYDVNKLATRQEMRTFVCGQCHVEYYFAKGTKVLTYPWSNGLKMEQIEEYYDEIDFKDWTHKETGAPSLKAQHPEFELWNQGIHARSGVSCSDCHMPYKRLGAIKISDHHIRSPLLNINRACQTCHHYPEAEIKDRAESIQDRTKALQMRAQKALAGLLDAYKTAEEKGMDPEVLQKAQQFQRKASWRLDFVVSENSLGFHAAQEAARILAEAIDYARQGELLIRKGEE